MNNRKKPKKLLYVRYRNWPDDKKGLCKSESETLVHLRERLHLAYPTVFSNVRTRDTIDVTLHEWYYDMGQESGFEKLWTVASIVTGCMILPGKLSYWYTKKVCLSYEVGEDLKKEEPSPIITPWISGDYCKSTYTGNLITPLFGWFFSPFHDYILTSGISVDDKELENIIAGNKETDNDKEQEEKERLGEVGINCSLFLHNAYCIVYYFAPLA